MTMEDHDVHDLLTQMEHLQKRNAHLTAMLTHFVHVTFNKCHPQQFFEAPYTGGGIYVGKPHSLALPPTGWKGRR